MSIDLKFLDKYLFIHSPGYVVEIYNNGKFFEKAIGYKMLKPLKKICDKNTLYDIASLTKTFTATLIYMAYQEKRISLNTSVYEIDHNFINLKDVTIRDLLCHNQEIYTNGYLGDAKSKKEFLNILYSAFKKTNIPTYVDIHYIILSFLLEKIYNKPFEKIILGKISTPLNLSSITFSPNKNLCAPNEIDIGEVHDKKARTAKKLGFCVGHAGLFCNGHDLLKFLLSFFNYSLLKKETISLMLEHNDIEKYNLKILKSLTDNNGDINSLYCDIIKKEKDLYLPLNYNCMGARYKNKIIALNDVVMPSDNSICFSGFTGPMYQIDFENKVIIVIMCNLLYNTKLNRKERKDKTVEIIENIVTQIY